MSAIRLPLRSIFFRLGLIGSLALTSLCASDHELLGVFNSDRDEIVSMVREKGASISSVERIRRNDFGTELYIFGDFEGVTTKRMLVLTNRGIRTEMIPSQGSFPVSGGKVIAWFEKESRSVHLISGKKIDVPAFAAFDVDPTGRYFMLAEKPAQTHLGNLDFPEKTQQVCTNFLGSRIYSAGNRIFICGHSYEHKKKSVSASAVCFVFKDTGDRFLEEHRIVLDWAGSIVDVDINSGMMLVRNRDDFHTRLYLFDINRKTRRSLGEAKAFQMFLSPFIFTERQKSRRQRLNPFPKQISSSFQR